MDYLWQHRRGQTGVGLLAQLPASVQAEVAFRTLHGHLSRVPSLNAATPALLRALALRMQPVLVLPGECKHACRALRCWFQTRVVWSGLLERPHLATSSVFKMPTIASLSLWSCFFPLAKLTPSMPFSAFSRPGQQWRALGSSVRHHPGPTHRHLLRD